MIGVSRQTRIVNKQSLRPTGLRESTNDQRSSISKKGFSLVEMLITLAIAGVAGAILMMILIQTNNTFFQQSAKVTQGVGLNDTFSRINQAIRTASFIAEKYPLDTPIYFSGPETLIVAYPSLDVSNKPIAGTYDYLIISKDAQNPAILREQFFPNPASIKTAANRVLLTNLSFLHFSYLGSNSELMNPILAKKVEFAVKVAEKTGLSAEETSRSGEINLRND